MARIKGLKVDKQQINGYKMTLKEARYIRVKNRYKIAFIISAIINIASFVIIFNNL